MRKWFWYLHSSPWKLNNFSSRIGSHHHKKSIFFTFVGQKAWESNKNEENKRIWWVLSTVLKSLFLNVCKCFTEIFRPFSLSSSKFQKYTVSVATIFLPFFCLSQTLFWVDKKFYFLSNLVKNVLFCIFWHKFLKEKNGKKTFTQKKTKTFFISSQENSKNFFLCMNIDILKKVSQHPKKHEKRQKIIPLTTTI